ncbi:MAG: type IV pilus assembly protein PilM [Clostridiales bacterium]
MALSLFSSDFLTVDIGFRYIKIVQLRKKKNNDVTIINFGIGDTPKGCIKNGAIKDQPKVIKEIKKVIQEHSLSAKEAKIVISGTNIITRIIMIDRVPTEDIDKAVWTEINTYLPINLNEHMVDYKVLGVINDSGKEKIKVFVTAVAKRIINSYLEILKSLNLKPIAVDIPANSVAKFFQKDIIHKETDSIMKKKKFSKLSSNTYAVIDLGSETSIVNILSNKVPEFNRVVLLGSSNIDATILRDLNLESHQLDQAERYKKMYGMVRNKDLNNLLEWDCSEAAKVVVNEIIKHMKMCFDFYIQRCAGEQISRMYLVGGGSQLKGLKDYLEDVFEMPVYPINFIEIKGIEFTSGLNKEKVNYLINAVGIAL